MRGCPVSCSDKSLGQINGQTKLIVTKSCWSLFWAKSHGICQVKWDAMPRWCEVPHELWCFGVAFPLIDKQAPFNELQVGILDKVDHFQITEALMFLFSDRQNPQTRWFVGALVTMSFDLKRHQAKVHDSNWIKGEGCWLENFKAVAQPELLIELETKGDHVGYCSFSAYNSPRLSLFFVNSPLIGTYIYNSPRHLTHPVCL
jgi:hypothetical protein